MEKQEKELYKWIEIDGGYCLKLDSLVEDVRMDAVAASDKIIECATLWISSSPQYSAQGQILYCTLRSQGRSSAQRQVFHRKLTNPGSSFTRDE